MAIGRLKGLFYGEQGCNFWAGPFSDVLALPGEILRALRSLRMTLRTWGSGMSVCQSVTLRER